MLKKENFSGMGGSSLDFLHAREERRREILEGTRTEYRAFQREELNALRDIEREVRIFTDQFGEEESSFFIDALEQKLDRFSFWKAKFSTGDYVGNSREYLQDLDVDPARDSLYYMSPSGATLRLKKAVLYDPVARAADTNHIENAVQPIADLVTFRKSGEDFHLELLPHIGFVVREYFTTTFQNALLQGAQIHGLPIVSPLELYVDDTGIRDIGCPSQFRAGTHDGHYVNKIFFVR